MFVKENSLQAIKEYFKKELSLHYSEREINQFLKLSCCARFNWSAADYILGDQERLSESDLLYFRGIVKRLLNFEPFQYIMGKVTFCELELVIDKRALVPRPETEELVHWISEHENLQSAKSILDLCTGSGCIAIAIKSIAKNVRVIGLDKSAGAIALAKVNAEQLQLAVEFSELDVLESSQYEIFQTNSFDCWVSNPPYIPASEMESLADNVRRHEPHMALFVDDENPLLFYEHIGKQAMVYLKSQAPLFFELHEDLAQLVVDKMIEIGFVNIELRKDLQGKNRMLKAQKP